MKSRIKIDVTLLIGLIVMTGSIYFFRPGVYSYSRTFDSVLDFLGVMAILKGTLLRMWARGHKKAFSDNSGRLVTTGPYTIVRNPMYLGTFLIGSGFVLVAWPWWVWPLFIGVFYIRFKKQILNEEAVLEKAFGIEYKIYCQQTPRIFPSYIRMFKVNWKKIFNWEEVLSTKERQGLIAWPIVAFALNCLQEKVIFGGVDLTRTVMIFISAYIVFALGTLMFFKKD